MVRNFKGLNYIGSTIFGYTLVPIKDYGTIGLSIRKNYEGYNTKPHYNNYNIDKRIKLLSYKKEIRK